MLLVILGCLFPAGGNVVKFHSYLHTSWNMTASSAGMNTSRMDKWEPYPKVLCISNSTAGLSTLKQPNKGLVNRLANGCSWFWPWHNNMRSFINNQFLFTQVFYVQALEGSPRHSEPT